MTKAEFEHLVDENITSEDYETIEYVYTWHPSITDQNGKREIATIYKIGGMRIIRDMVRSARDAERLENINRHLKNLSAAIKEEFESLAKGNPITLCLEDIERKFDLL